VVLTTENMDGATSPLLHLFSFTSQNLDSVAQPAVSVGRSCKYRDFVM